MGEADIVPIRPLSADEALQWLLRHAPVALSRRELARRWVWNEKLVARRLEEWEEAELIGRSESGVITAPADADDLADDTQFVARKPASAGVSVRLIAVLVGFLATALGLLGLTLNARYAASFGQSTEAGLMLAAIGLTSEGLALVLPSAASHLWQRRHIVLCGVTWAIWAGCVCMTLIAASGFASQNIGDAIAGRSKIGDTVAGMTERLHRLQSERRQISEARAVATINAELQYAQGTAGDIWKVTKECSDITRAESARLCKRIQDLRQAHGWAVRRDEIDRDVIALEQQLSTMPAAIVGDPGAAMLSELVEWISHGHIRLTERDVQRARILGLTGLPAFAGVLFMIALSLGRNRSGARVRGQ